MQLLNSLLPLFLFSTLATAIPNRPAPHHIQDDQSSPAPYRRDPDYAGQMAFIAALQRAQALDPTNPAFQIQIDQATARRRDESVIVVIQAQIQALQQQLVGMTDPHAIAAIQTQMNQDTMNPAWSTAGWNSAQVAFMSQIQALQQQLVGMTDPHAIAAVQSQIAAIQTQMNQGVVGWNGFAGTTANQQRNAALLAQEQAIQSQLVGMTDVNAQEALIKQVAAIQAQVFAAV
ncbi:hypothetical protein HDU98_007400 [Podochytrium sp. JEL0797]|nr:hypothetical protein HDU98_007400 [Podochytrium sp. JEL0797]